MLSTVNWALLWIHAIGNLGNNKSIIEFEDNINKSENGILYDLNYLRS